MKAIVDGDPPDLPVEGFSDAARDFVRGCLNKTPKLRPTYAMLLRHPWLVPLLKPPTITVIQEESASGASDDKHHIPPEIADVDVAAWACEAMERRREGKMGNKAKPALHAAPLNAVGGSI